MCKELFKNEPARSKVGYTILFYLPLSFLLSIFILLLPSITDASPLWTVVGIKLFSVCLYIYGAAEMYCLRSIMICSITRMLAPVLLCFWSLHSLTWTVFLYATLEVSFGTATLLAYVSETLSDKMLKQLTERTLLGGLDESIVMPSYTRIAVCLMSVLEWVLGLRCILKPHFIEWFAQPPPTDSTEEVLSFHSAAICFGTTSVITSTMLLIAVVIFKVAAIKWWIAAYHMSIALSLVPLKLILGTPFQITFFISAFHFIAGLTITILPSALKANAGVFKSVEKRLDKAEQRLKKKFRLIEQEVDEVTGRDRDSKKIK